MTCPSPPPLPMQLGRRVLIEQQVPQPFCFSLFLTFCRFDLVTTLVRCFVVAHLSNMDATAHSNSDNGVLNLPSSPVASVSIQSLDATLSRCVDLGLDSRSLTSPSWLGVADECDGGMSALDNAAVDATAHARVRTDDFCIFRSPSTSFVMLFFLA